MAINNDGHNNTRLIINDTDIADEVNTVINLNQYHKVNIDKVDNNLELNINVSQSYLKTFTVNDPDRLIVDVLCIKNNPPVQSLSNKRKNEIYPGVIHKTYRLKGPVVVNVLDIDLNNPMIDLAPVTASPNTLFSKKSINQIVSKEKALAGINASFFKPPTGLPLGTLIIDENIVTGPIFNRVALVIDKDNKAYLDKVSFNGYFTLPDNTKLKFHNINQPRLSVEGYMLYSDKWNTLVPKTLKNELQIAVVEGKIVQKTTGSIRVPHNGYVITGHNKDSFKALNVGDSLNIVTKYNSYVPKIKHAIGGGPYLLKNGNVYIDSSSQKFQFSNHKREPRTAVAITKDNHLLLVTVDGRQSKSIGMSFYGLAEFLKSIGAVHAMNFDGGSSTQMSIRGKTVNYPTVRGGAYISTGIIVRNVDLSIANRVP